MQRFGRYQRKNGLVLDIVNVLSLTLTRHAGPRAAGLSGRY